MGRKYIPTQAGSKQRKIFLDDLKKIHKRRQREVPTLPKYSDFKEDNTTNISE